MNGPYWRMGQNMPCITIPVFHIRTSLKTLLWSCRMPFSIWLVKFLPHLSSSRQRNIYYGKKGLYTRAARLGTGTGNTPETMYPQNPVIRFTPHRNVEISCDDTTIRTLPQFSITSALEWPVFLRWYILGTLSFVGYKPITREVAFYPSPEGGVFFRSRPLASISQVMSRSIRVYHGLGSAVSLTCAHFLLVSFSQHSP